MTTPCKKLKTNLICLSIPEEPINDKATEKEREDEHLRSLLKISSGYFDAMNQYHQESPPDYDQISRDEYQEHSKRERDEITRIWHEKLDKDIRASRAREAPLIEKQGNEAKQREVIKAREIQTYLKDNPSDVKSLKLDVGRYSSIYVFSFEYAKLESSKYKKFIKSLKDDNLINYGVYFGRKESLSKIFGLNPGLHEIESLVFEEDEFLTLPPRSSATNLCVKLKELGMPVELNGGRIKLTKVFSVCEDKRVTEDSTKILRLLKQKMFKYALVPLCCWSASTGETEYFDLNLPRSG
ncbi:hypothetical protein MKW98_018931 [Papaver atlanticum]|uniref:Uncharacterized protein n=1 Tax=Papaver atlanticum TaxID=357466 RepID=A0AAD4TJ69_9MAGN|nr:hypothetical protein MKW98_018931 [Papaver atlanticum]